MTKKRVDTRTDDEKAQDRAAAQIEELLIKINRYCEDKVWVEYTKQGLYWLYSSQQGSIECLGTDLIDAPNVLAQWFANR